MFKDLIADQPNSTRIVVFQGRVVEAAAKLGNKRYTVNESRTLTNYFVKAVKKQAAALIEQKAKRRSWKKTFARRAGNRLGYRTAAGDELSPRSAGKTKNDELYGYAMELYSNYLTVVPETLYAY